MQESIFTNILKDIPIFAGLSYFLVEGRLKEILKVERRVRVSDKKEEFLLHHPTLYHFIIYLILKQ